MKGEPKFPERNAEIIRRRNDGELPRQIAKAMGLRKNVVIGVCNRAGLSDPEGWKATCVRGEETPNAVLTEELVRDLRAFEGSHAAAARRFGLVYETVREARKRNTWKHVA